MKCWSKQAVGYGGYEDDDALLLHESHCCSLVVVGVVSFEGRLPSPNGYLLPGFVPLLTLLALLLPRPKKHNSSI